jgi:hypothetical protein
MLKVSIQLGVSPALGAPSASMPNRHRIRLLVPKVLRSPSVAGRRGDEIWSHDLVGNIALDASSIPKTPYTGSVSAKPSDGLSVLTDDEKGKDFCASTNRKAQK